MDEANFLAACTAIGKGAKVMSAETGGADEGTCLKIAAVVYGLSLCSTTVVEKFVEETMAKVGVAK